MDDRDIIRSARLWETGADVGGFMDPICLKARVRKIVDEKQYPKTGKDVLKQKIIP